MYTVVRKTNRPEYLNAHAVVLKGRGRHCVFPTRGEAMSAAKNRTDIEVIRAGLYARKLARKNASE